MARIRRRVTSFITAMALVLSMFGMLPAGVLRATAGDMIILQGRGTKDDPYIAYSYEELKWELRFADSVSDPPYSEGYHERYIKLGCDIFTDDPWALIECNHYTGSYCKLYFDLAGHTIKKEVEESIFQTFVSVYDDSSIIIDDSVGGGRIEFISAYHQNNGDYNSVICTRGGDLIINGGTFSLGPYNPNNTYSYAIHILGAQGNSDYDGSELKPVAIINGGRFIGHYTSICHSGQQFCTLIVNGGKFETELDSTLFVADQLPLAEDRLPKYMPFKMVYNWDYMICNNIMINECDMDDGIAVLTQQFENYKEPKYKKYTECINPSSTITYDKLTQETDLFVLGKNVKIRKTKPYATGVSIEPTAPVGGRHPADAKLSWSRGIKLGSTVWKDVATGKTLKSSDVFVAGKKYEMSVGLSASDGYILGTIPTVSSWNCSVTPIVKPIEPIAGRYSCSYTFTCRAPITNIDLDVATPLPLHDAEEPFVMTNGAAVERYEWVNQSGSNVARFFVNNTYTLKTYITAEEGYDFGSTVTATVNGKTAKITKAAGSTSATEYIVEYTFDKLIQYKVKFDPGKGTGTMSDVTVNKGFAYTVPECGFKAPAGHYFSKWTDGTNYYAPGDPVTVTSDITLTPVWICRVSGVNVVLTEPKSGEAINETMTSVTDGIDVARGTQSSTRNLGRWYHGDTVMSAGEKFVGGETYTAMFRLKSLTGYEFTETPDVYANGKKATFLSASGVYRTYTVSYTLPLETKYVSQVNVTLTEPKKGETINETMISSTEGIVVNRAKTDTTYNLGRWYHNNTVMKAGDKFLAGETYTAQFRLVPSTGYGLANNLKVYANGKQATLNTGALLANTYAVSFTLPEEQPETYDLCVGDVQVTDLNADDILGNGAAYYDPETNTLELIATVGGRVNYAVNNSISGLTILVNEDISLYGAKAAIRCAADTVITGPGKLTLKTGSNSSILLSSKDLLIEDANICTDTKYFVCGVKGIERLTVKNSTVDANCSVAAIDNIAELTLKDCSFLIPAGGIFKLGTVYKSDGSTVAARVKIVPGDNIRKGDINSDGHVDVTDLTILARSLAKWTGYAAQVNEANADVDGDGEVTVTDYSILARALARWPGYAEEHNIVLG